MSATVFAGAAQFAALPLWTAPLPLLPIWLSTFALNARFMLLSASLATWLRRAGGRRAWASVALMGEGPWAVATRAYGAGERDLGVFVGSGLVVWTVWLAGTVAGFVASPYLGDPKRLGLDLVLVLFFAATLASAWRGPRDLVPWMAAAAATMIPASIVAPEWQILTASLIGAAAGAWRDARP